MKRKLALLLAAVMTITSLPTMNVFAATNNRLTSSVSVVPEKTLFIEEGTNSFTDNIGDVVYSNNVSPGPVEGHKDIKYKAQAPELVLDVTDYVKSGDQIRLELENASWFFRGNVDISKAIGTGSTRTVIPSGSAFSDLTNLGIPSGGALMGGYTALDNPAIADYVAARINNSYWRIIKGNADYFASLKAWNPSAANENYSGSTDKALAREANNRLTSTRAVPAHYGYYRETYNQIKGIWGATGNEGKAGVYVRHGGIDTTDRRTEVPYTLEVLPSNDKTAILRVEPLELPDGTVIDYFSNSRNNPYGYGDWQIRIPLVTRTAEGDVDAKVRIIHSNTTGISTTNAPIVFAIGSSGMTNTFVDDPQTARDNFPINKLVIKETRLNSIKSNFSDNTNKATVYITAPTGFEFKDPNGLKDGKRIVEVGVERGLTWSGGRVGYGNSTISGDSTIHGDYTIDYKQITSTSGGSTTNNDDLSVLELTINNINPSTDVLGLIYITGLEFYAEDNAPWGDIMFKITNATSSKKMVTNQEFKAGTRLDWTISLTTEGTIPELVNGRYEKAEPINADDATHKTAKVVFAENSVAAWWAERQTVFSLPEGVKYRKVEITDVDELEDSYKTALLETNYKSSLWNNLAMGDGVYINDAEKHGYVTINGNTMTWNNLKIKRDKKAKIKFDVWVSIESGFKGDVTMSVGGSGIPTQGEDKTVVPSVVIAKQISPITITTKVQDIKIGYQYQKTEDIIITETKAGNLQKGKTVLVSISDMISTDMYFSPDTKVAVTDGNLKIKNVSHVANGYVAAGQSTLALGGGTISFDIDMASSKASTIKLTNVSVKIDRTVPLSNDRPYQVVVWGSAIAPNYNYYNHEPKAKDRFATAGIMANYTRVVSAAEDQSNILTQEVKVAIGESYYTVNGKPFDMDASAYISTKSNSTMVPVRFIANAFGINDSQVIWDDSNKTVTVTLPWRVVQFTANESTMILNGAPVTMYSPDGLQVVPEIVDDRCYVPFRALGQAFGIEVDWEDSTQTAVYNPGANRNAVAGSVIASDKTMTENMGE